MREYVVDPATGCWVWQRGTNSKGYGVKVIDGRKVLAHRWYYEQARGPIPAGKVLDHVVCQRRRCVNPDHLEAISNTENVRRGRATRFTAEQVREMRRLWDGGRGLTQREIGRLFGTGQSTVSKIVRGARWADLA